MLLFIGELDLQYQKFGCEVEIVGGGEYQKSCSKQSRHHQCVDNVFITLSINLALLPSTNPCCSSHIRPCFLIKMFKNFAENTGETDGAIVCGVRFGALLIHGCDSSIESL